VSRLWEHYEDQAREEALAHEAWEASQEEAHPYSKSDVASVLARHRGWLQAGPRSSTLIYAVLFPRCPAKGMTRDRTLVRISRALFDAGYTPSDHSPNPIWAWTESK